MNADTPSGEHSPVRGWILYDDTCGFCRTLAPRLMRRLRDRGIALAPLQAPWVAGRIGATPADLAGDIRLLLPDGTIIRGADVYRFVLRERVWTYPFYILSRVPPARQVFDLCYRLVARYRHRVSRICALPGADTRPQSGG